MIAHQGSDTSQIDLAEVPSFMLGEVAVEPSERRLCRGDEVLLLEPRAMQVLVALAEAKGAIVSTKALVDRCWDGRFVGDNAIHRVLSQLRKAAATVGAGSFEIENVKKVGYRLVAPGLTSSPARRAGLSRRVALVGAGALAVVALPVGGLYWLNQPSPARRESLRLMALAEETRRTRGDEAGMQVLDLLRQATKADADHGAAWGARALACLESVSSTDPDEQVAGLAELRRSAERALALEPGNEMAMRATLLALPTFGNWGEVETLALAAARQHPESAVYATRLGDLYANVGRWREAIAYHRTALRIEPLVLRHRQVEGLALWGRGDPAGAAQSFEAGLHQSPDDIWLLTWRLFLAALNGDPAIVNELTLPNTRIATAGIFTPFPAPIARAVSDALHTSTDRAIATAIGAVVEGRRSRRLWSGMSIPCLSALGAIDIAFAQAEAYYLAPRKSGLPEDPRTSSLFLPPCAALRADPRFADLVERIGLAGYWRATGIVPDVGLPSAGR